MASQVYDICLTNWQKHNGGIKKGHTHFLLSKRFLNDEKIANCRPIEVILFIHCLQVACDMMTNKIHISSTTLPKQLRMGNKALANGLESLEQNQLLTVEKNTPFINRIEKKGIEENRITLKSRTKVSRSQTAPTLSDQKTSGFIAKYCELFKARYLSNPIVDGKSAGIAKRVSKAIGDEKSNRYLEAFFQMPDADLVKSKHPLSKFEFKLNEITVFAESGKFTPRAQASDVDREMADEMKKQKDRQETIQMLKEMNNENLLEMKK
jgi:hypothetical protein